MTPRNTSWMQGTGVVATVFALSLLTIMTGLQSISMPAYAAERGVERRDARGMRQEGRDEAREQKKECKDTDGKSRAECRREKRETKDDARDAARDIKRK